MVWGSLLLTVGVTVTDSSYVIFTFSPQLSVAAIYIYENTCVCVFYKHLGKEVSVSGSTGRDVSSHTYVY